jgi:TldD protein
MIRPCLLLIACLNTPAMAEPTTSAADDPVVSALKQELARVVPQLTLADHEAPYHVRLNLETYDTFSARGSRGALVFSKSGPGQYLRTVVRVGSPELDNLHFGSRWSDDGAWTDTLGFEHHPGYAAHTLWKTLDTQYKRAITQLGKREASRRQYGHQDFSPSFVLGEVYQDHLPSRGASTVPLTTLEDAARQLSTPYRAAPWVDGSVGVWYIQGTRHIFDTAGTDVSEPSGQAGVRARLTVTADDGQQTDRTLFFVARTWAQLPSTDHIEQAIQQEVQRLAAWRGLPAETEAYVGPVVFEADAATALFGALLLPELSGTPAREEERTGGPSRDARTTVEPLALKRRVLPNDWTVTDSPTADMSLASSYTYDDEGVPAQDVLLVDKGIVRDHYMTRLPNKHVSGSNGHARTPQGHEPKGCPSWTTIDAPKSVSAAKLRKRALKLAQDLDLDHIMVVRSVAPSEHSDGNTSNLHSPSELLRVYADGREEPVRGLTWTALDRRSLRSIVAAGPSLQTFASDGVSVTVTAPSVLLEEVELVPQKPADLQDPKRMPPGP